MGKTLIKFSCESSASQGVGWGSPDPSYQAPWKQGHDSLFGLVPCDLSSNR